MTKLTSFFLRKSAYLYLAILLSTTVLGQNFVTTWETTIADETITIPTNGSGYDYVVDWGDGSTDSGVLGDITHTYALPGTQTVTISGDFPRIYFNDSGDKDKIQTIEEWGTIAWTSMEDAFDGCTNLIITATDAPDLSGVTSLNFMFAGATSLQGDLSSWDVSTITEMNFMLSGATLSTNEYDNLLIGWSALSLQNDVTFDAGNSQYCSGLMAREDLINNFNWTIQDAGSLGLDDFVTTWKTDNPGTSNPNQITITTFGGGYNYSVDWESDGIFDEFGLTGDATHTYASAGTYQVTIRGCDFPRIYFNNSGDREKLLSIDAWGEIPWTTMESAFYGCSNLIINAADQPILTDATSMNAMFKDATMLNQDISVWDVSEIVDMQELFSGASSFNQDLSSWDVSNVTNMTSMFASAALSTSNYDNLLIAWSGLTLQNGVSFDAGGSQYCEATSQRNDIITNFGWTILDAGDCTNEFTTIWKTDNPGTSNMDQITIPTNGAGYSYDVDWENDGIFDDFGVTGDITHTYLMAGEYEVAIQGNFPSIYFNDGGDKEKLLSVNQWGTNVWDAMDASFYGCSNLQLLATDVPDLSAITSLDETFKNATSLTQGVANWDVAAVTSMVSTFEGASSFNDTINGWTVTNVLDMTSMFSGASTFNVPLPGWNVGMVTDMTSMFANASSFNQDIGGWDVASVTDMSGMFSNVSLSVANYDSLLIGWEAQTLQPNVTFDGGNSQYCAGDTAKMDIETNSTWTFTDGGLNCAFDFVTRWKTDNPGTSGMDEITIPTEAGETYDYTVDWGDGTTDMNVTGDITHTYASPGVYTVNISGDFPRIYFNDGGDKAKLLSIENWSTNPWTSMEGAFFGCENMAINAADVPDLSGVASMSNMLTNATLFDADVSGWDVGTVTDMGNLFNGAVSFQQGVAGWVVDNVTDMNGMFANIPSFNEDISGWNTGMVQDMSGMFAGVVSFNQDIGGWDVAMVENMSGMFAGATFFNQDIGGWTVDAVTDMSGMFVGNTFFDQDISGWIVTNVDNMNGMFAGAENFNQDIGGWDVSNVTDMEAMFVGNSNFNQDISGWIVDSVLNMKDMFRAAGTFNQDLSSWNVDLVTDMSGMFFGASVFNQDISGWNVAAVTLMDEMFVSAFDFDQDLGMWDVSNVTSMVEMFSNVELSAENYDSLLIGWNGLGTLQPGVEFDGGNSTYCAGEAARTNLIAVNGWIITDAGTETTPPVPDLADIDVPMLTGECEITFLTPLTAFDSCAGAIVGTPDVILPITTQGASQIIWTFDDGNGNISTQTQEVFLEDVTAPTITCGATINVDSDPGICGAVVNFTLPNVVDNCSGFTIESNHNSGDTFDVGTTNVIYTVTDVGGNTATCNFDIVVADIEDPTLSGCPSNVTINLDPVDCDTTVTWTEPMALDNCSAILTKSHNPGDVFQIGTTTVTYTATDSSGNIEECSFDVVVNDVEDPVYTNCPGNIFISNAGGGCTATAFWTPPTGSDNCSATFTASHVPGDSFPLGTTTVTYTAEDLSGNIAICAFEVTVEDTVAPTITGCPNNISVSNTAGVCGAIVNYTPPTITDNCVAPTITNSHDTGDVFPIGVTTVTYTATDATGNSNTCSFTVTVADTELPVFTTCPSNITVPADAGSCAAIVNFTTPVEFDNCSATVVSSHASGDSFPVGDTVVNFTATDPAGNVAICEFTITVEDLVDPVISGCPADIVLQNIPGSCSNVATWTSPNANDDCPVSLTSSHASGDSFDVGVTTVTYIAEDAAGNQSACSFTVTVEDNELPTVVCQDITVELDAAGTISIAATALDNGSGDNCGIDTFSVDISSFDCSNLGPNNVILTVTDVNGNSDSCSAVVTVIDDLDPVLTCPPNQTVTPTTTYEVPDYFALGDATALDNCTDPLTLLSQDPLPGTLLSSGTYTVLITAEDAAGNNANCTFELIVDSILGVSEIELSLSTVQLHPNPAGDIVFLSNPQLVPITEIMIYSLTGSVVLQERQDTLKEQISLDISRLPSAPYLMVIHSEGKQLTKRLLKN